MKKIICMCLCGLTAAGIFLTGCAESGEAQSETPSMSSVYQNGKSIGDHLKYYIEAPVNNKEELQLQAWINEDWSCSYKKLFQEYEKLHPNVQIKVTQLPWNTYWKKLIIAMQSGKGPDIFHMHNDYAKEMRPYLAQFPESQLPYSLIEQDFLQTESALYEGKLYYMNIGLSTGGIFYNKKMWKDAGLTDKDIPETWDELRLIAKRLTKYDDNGNIVVDGFNCNENEEFLLMAMQLQCGIPIFTEDQKKSKFCNGSTIQNVTFLRNLYLADNVCRPNKGLNNDMLGRGEAAMIYNWTWVASYLDQFYPEIEYGFFRPPVMDGETEVYDRNNFECTFGVNNASSEDKKLAAFDLMKFYLCSDEILLTAAEQAKIVPNKHTLLQNSISEEDEIIYEQSQYIDKTVFVSLISNHVGNILRTQLGVNIMNENHTPIDILKTTDDEIEKALADK